MVTKEILEDLYVNKQMTVKEICKHLSMGKNRVYAALKDYGIPRRKGYFRKTTIQTSDNGDFIYSYKDKDFLIECLHRQRLTLTEIGNMFSVDRKAVSYYVKKHGIAPPEKEYVEELILEILCTDCKCVIKRKMHYLKQRIREGTFTFVCKDCVSKRRSSEEHLARLKEISEQYFSTKEGLETRKRAVFKATQASCDGRRTSIEVKMAEELENRGLKYIEQYSLGDKFLIDFYIPQYNIAIECDGDYWHRLPKNVKRDKAKNAYIKACGISLYRFWESEINTDVEACVDITMKEINNISDKALFR
ncbi:DUF559 domain-containing protein [Listeria monocytogenes]|nr:DUF559 domain-containing protein [Listeria monocytogenes]